jgi:hypothetical protein
MLTYLSFERADFTIIHNSFSNLFKNLPSRTYVHANLSCTLFFC